MQREEARKFSVKAFSTKSKKHIHLVESTGEIDNSFVGLKIFGDDVYIHYPENYTLKKDDKFFVDDVLSLLNTFSIAKTLSNDSGLTYIGDSEGEFRLNAYIWIITDYLQYGLYVNREKVYRINQMGKINWKRTLNQKPIVSNGNIIYNDLVTEQKTVVDETIVNIHKYCVKKSLEFIGWLFNLSGDFIESNEINEKIRQYYIYVVQQELSTTFDDHKKELFRNLIFVLRGLSEYDSKKPIHYGVDQYHFIFEKMIDNIFGSARTKDFYPKGKWELLGSPIFDSSSLRPDTIMADDENVYIIDSKYYRYGKTANINDLPETSSIQKQIAYGEYAKKLHNSKTIYNAFLIPYNKLNNKFNSHDIVYIGKASSDVNKQTNSYEYVYSFLIDLKHVVKTYNKHNHGNDITYFKDQIAHYSTAI